MSNETLAPLAVMAVEARSIASRAFSDNSASLICRETKYGKTRCLDKPRKPKRGETMVPFRDYDPREMCHPCAAYWYAEMAAQTLEDLAAWERRLAAETAQKAK